MELAGNRRGAGRSRLRIALVLGSIGTLLLGVDAGAAGPPNNALTLDPTSALPGATVTVSGGNCSGGHTVQVDLDAVNVVDQAHNGDTTWQATITVPAEATVGDHTVTARCLISGATFDYAPATLTVTAPPASSTSSTTSTTAPPAEEAPITFAERQSGWDFQDPFALTPGTNLAGLQIDRIVNRFVLSPFGNFNNLNFAVCLGGLGVRVGPYGTISATIGRGCDGPGGFSGGVRAAAAAPAQTTGDVFIGTLSTDANGVFTGDAKVPVGTPPGDYVLQFVAKPSNVVFEIPLRVSATPLARTGDDHGPLTTVAVGMLLAGAGLVVESGLRRRRRHAR